MNRTFVIAELANTHNGSFERAEALIRKSAAAGADAIKFQYFKTEDLVGPDHPEYSVFKKLEFQPNQWKTLFEISRSVGLKTYCDVFGLSGVDFVQELGCQGLKIHSSDTGNTPLLEKVGRTKLPILLSLAAATPRDAWKAVRTLRKAGAQEITLMLGFQAFPTRLEDCKLELIQWYQNEFQLPIGYADHVDGASPMAITLPLLARSAGAQVIEKHITYDRASKPEDYESALEPEDFKTMVEKLRETELAIGSQSLVLSDAEKAYSRRMKKFPLASKNLSAGAKLQASDIKMQRLDGGSDAFPAEMEDILSRTIQSPISQGTALRHSSFKWKTAILIAVRSRSNRLPEKAFIDIGGRPAIVQLIDRMKRCTRADEIILCTTAHPEDERLVTVAKECGIRSFRGSEFDVMGRFVGASEESGADILVRVTGDDILSDPEYIDRAIDLHLSTNAEYTWTEGLPYGVDREIISSRVLKWIHQNARDVKGTEYMTWYLDNPAFVRVSKLTADARHQRPQYRLTLDTEADLKVFRWIYDSLHKDKPNFTLDDVISLIDRHPEMSKLNFQVPSKLKRSDIDTSLKWNTAKE